jgi:hypothetical protein
MITAAARRLLLLFLLPLAAFAQPAPIYPAEAVRQDLAFLYDTLQANLSVAVIHAPESLATFCEKIEGARASSFQIQG